MASNILIALLVISTFYIFVPVVKSMSRSQRDFILQKHNEVRSHARPAAADMRLMVRFFVIYQLGSTFSVFSLFLILFFILLP